MKIKILRKIGNGPEKGAILEARSVSIEFGNRSFQILSDGDFLGHVVGWMDAVELEPTGLRNFLKKIKSEVKR